MRRQNAFTLIELLVVISIIALLIAILLPALGAARKSARQAQNNVNLRTLHQAAYIHGQENKTWYPGYDSNGVVKNRNEINGSYGNLVFTAAPGHNGSYTVPRFIEMMASGIITHDHIFSPGENASVKQIWNPGGGDPNLRHINISYAVLDLGGSIASADQTLNNSAARAWQDSASSETPIFSDRNASTNVAESFSIWNEQKWEGGVVFNDGHTEYRQDQIVESTLLGNTSVQDDDLFDFPTIGVNGEPRGEHVRMIKRNANETIGLDS